MLIGRFLIIIPMLALAGNLGRKKQVPPSLGTFPVTTPLFATLLVGVIVIVGALTFFPVLSLGPIVEHFLMRAGHDVLMDTTPWPTTQKLQHLGSGDRSRRASSTRVRKLDPRMMVKNPVMFVVEVGAVADDGPAGARRRRRPRRHRLRAADHALAVGHGAVRQLRRSDGRRARQGAGRHAAQGADRDRRQPARRRRARPRRCRPPSLRKGDVVHGAGRRVHPVRRRDHRGRRVGGRVGDHRRVGAGDPRGRRRSLGGHRRHAGAVGLDQGPRHRRSRADVPRPDDRAGRRRRAAEDAERDRAQHPAGRADDHLPAGGGHAAAVRDLLRRAAVDVRAGVAAGLPDPDDDRRAAVGDRHRRHGPAGPAQRAGDVGPRGRGGRRRAHAAARQDRHDHARQPAGDRVHPARRA